MDETPQPAPVAPVIRPLEAAHREAWGVLWQGYCAFYEQALPAEVTDLTFARLLDPAEPVNGWGAFDAGGALLGFVICVSHRSSWSARDYVYLEDLFTAPAQRGKGVARALIEAVCAFARQQGAARVYWHTHESNARAQALYDALAERSGSIVYRRAP